MRSIIEEIRDHLKSVNYDGDLSDLGNEIGIILGNYIDENKLGYELESFFHGVKHGVSLTKGTH